jgi:hypothetical protein
MVSVADRSWSFTGHTQEVNWIKNISGPMAIQHALSLHYSSAIMVKKIGSAYIATQNLVTFHQKITPA